MTSHDQLFKDLLQAFFGDLLKIVVPSLAEKLQVEEVQFLREEFFTDLPQGKRRAVDLLAQLPTLAGDPELVLVHVEAERRARPDTGRRLWRYRMQICLRYDLPLIPMVLYLEGGKPGVRRERVEDILWGQELASFTYFALSLSASQAEDYMNRPEPLAWALSGPMKSPGLGRSRHKLEALRRIVRADVDEARRFLLTNFVETYVQLTEEEEVEYQKLLGEESNREVAQMEMTWAEKIRQEGRQEGLQEGRQEGLQEGRQEGLRRLRQLVLSLLETRWGPVTESVREQVRGMESEEQLTRVAQRLAAGEGFETLGLDASTPQGAFDPTTDGGGGDDRSRK